MPAYVRKIETTELWTGHLEQKYIIYIYISDFHVKPIIDFENTPLNIWLGLPDVDKVVEGSPAGGRGARPLLRLKRLPTPLY